jgi:hypothetical protein
MSYKMPCKDCIILPMCKAKVLSRPYHRDLAVMLLAKYKCSLLDKYLKMSRLTNDYTYSQYKTNIVTQYMENFKYE